jgi:two-component system cell cycle sensor histidine kinase/response regulator CckA
VPPGQYVVISVADEGCGIPEDRLARIFEPFFTTKRPGEGTGLGLSMAYGIVKQSGGYIFADSVVDEGTTFEIYLPAARARPADAAFDTIEAAKAGTPRAPMEGDVLRDVAPTGRSVAEVPPAQTMPASPRTSDDDAADRADAKGPMPEDWVRTARRRVMVVEDEAPVRAFALRALRLRGYDVIEAACAEDALEALADPELHVDLFLTDVMMPGLDGPTWVRRAMESRPGVRTVFMSGYAEDALSSAPPIPHALFLAKPFSLAGLTQVVGEALDGPAPG